MNLKQILRIAIVAILATSQSYSSVTKATVTLIDQLVSGSGVQDIMMKRGMKATSIPKQQSTLVNAYKALGLTATPTADQIKAKLLLIKKNDPSETKVIDSILSKLNTKSNDITEDQLRETMNSIVRMSMRKGGLGTALTECSKCNDDLVQIIEQENKYVKDIMKSFPKTDKNFSMYLKKKMRGLGGVPKRKVLPKDDQRILAVFTELPKRGSKSQKKFASSLKSFSKDESGKVNLFSSNLWKIPSQNTTDGFLDSMTTIIKQAEKEMKTTGATHEDAFYTVLSRMAKDDEDMLDEAASIKANNCFFGK